MARLRNETLVQQSFTFKTGENERAEEVAIVGEWGCWVVLHPLRQQTDGRTWDATINIPPGSHQFKFLVDGK